MERLRLQQLLVDAGVPVGPEPTSSPPVSLCAVADAALKEAGIAAHECEAITSALAQRATKSATAAQFGAGFSAWSLSQAGPILRFATDNNLKIADFVVTNIKAFTAGWDDVTPAVAKFATEFALGLPGDSLDLGMKLIRVWEQQDAIARGVWEHLESGVDLHAALDAVGVAVDVEEAVSAVSTMGLTLLAGWLGKKVVTSYYEPELEMRRKKLSELQELHASILRVREAIRSEIPTTVLCQDLVCIDQKHWAF